MTLLETGAPANALPRKAAEMGLHRLSVSPVVNYKTHVYKCLCGTSDKGDQSLAGWSRLLLHDENINTRKESQYLKALRGRVFSLFGFSHRVQRLGKAWCLFSSVCAWQNNSKNKEDITLFTVFWKRNH